MIIPDKDDPIRRDWLYCFGSSPDKPNVLVFAMAVQDPRTKTKAHKIAYPTDGSVYLAILGEITMDTTITRYAGITLQLNVKRFPYTTVRGWKITAGAKKSIGNIKLGSWPEKTTLK
jgi:hypothetical protein